MMDDRRQLAGSIPAAEVGNAFIERLTHFAQIKPDAFAAWGPGGQRLTHADQLRLVRGFAACLAGQGCSPGDLVWISLRNPLLDAVVTLACLHQGLVSCSSVQAEAPPPTLKPQCVVTDYAQDWVQGLACLRVDQALLDALRPQPLAPHQWGADDVARLLLSSGTTGRPKAVMLSHAQLVRRASGRQDSISSGREPSLTLMRLASGPGVRLLLAAVLHGDAFHHANNPNSALDTMLGHSIVGLQASPVQLRALCQLMRARGISAPSIRETWITGGLLDPTVARQWRSLAPNLAHLYCGYGSSETGGAAYFEDGVDAVQDGSLGWAAPGVQLRIVDDAGCTLPAGHSGRVAIHSDWVALGYWNEPELQQRCFRDGWFHSNDIGSLSADGELLLQGRSEEVINIGGVKANPDELDQRVLLFAGVKDAATFRIRHPDGGDAVGLALVLEGGELDREAFRAHLLATFGVTLFPAHVWRVEGIPRNAMGKVSRQQLAQRLLRRAP